MRNIHTTCDSLQNLSPTQFRPTPTTTAIPHTLWLHQECYVHHRKIPISLVLEGLCVSVNQAAHHISAHELEALVVRLRLSQDEWHPMH